MHVYELFTFLISFVAGICNLLSSARLIELITQVNESIF